MGFAKYLTFFFFLAAVFGTGTPTLYAQRFVDDNSDSWFILHSDTQLNDRWSVPTTTILRYHDVFDYREFSFISSGIAYTLNKNSQVNLGMAYLSSAEDPTVLEDPGSSQYWLFESYSYTHSLGYGQLNQRVRLESRWINTNHTTRFTNRLRYRLQYMQPIFEGMHAKAFNEIFIGLDGDFFDQNRFYVGLGQKISPSFSLDIGYLKNHFKSEHRDVIRMCLTVTTNFSKRKEVRRLRSAAK